MGWLQKEPLPGVFQISIDRPGYVVNHNQMTTPSGNISDGEYPHSR